MIQNFNEKAYFEANKKIKEAIKKGTLSSALEHLKKYGLKEIKAGKRKFHKDLEAYSKTSYLKIFPEVEALVKSEKYSSVFDHFCKVGYGKLLEEQDNKNSIAKPVKKETPLQKEVPVKKEVPAKKALPAEAELIRGFNEEAYLEANPKVKAAIEKGDFKSLGHYMRIKGLKNIEKGLELFHKDFYHFDEKLYLEFFPDVKDAIARGDFVSGFQHFCRYGYQGKIVGHDKWPSAKETELLDTEFYAAYHKDLQDFKKLELIKHWKKHGSKEKRYGNLNILCKVIGFKFDFDKLNIDTIKEINPLLSALNKSEIFIKILQVKKIDLIRLSQDDDFDARFYLELGKAHLIRGEKELSHQILLYSLYLNPTSECSELLGNYYIDKGQQKQALAFYAEAWKDNDYKSLWLCININQVYRTLHNYDAALDVMVQGLNKFKEDSQLLKILDETIHQTWEYEQENLHALAKQNDREALIVYVNLLSTRLAEVYRKVFTGEQLEAAAQLNSKRVLIIGDYHIPQCIRYRIDQKFEQLELAGYEVTTVSWTELHERYDEIFFHDIIIYYRVPANPVIIKSIEKARSLGKVTFYEIDDLIFDSVYPPAYETYGGNISIEQYGGLTYGMPLFQAAAKLCKYAIASTEPLLTLLQPLVTSQKGFLHRNGLDSLNVFMSKKEKKYINIFYGSGTLAHNSDFIDLTLGAVEQILNENKNVKLTIVGHLTLPESFRTEFEDQIILLKKTTTIEHYWSYLSGADINLAVLHNDVINNSKSELKWFEAACFKIPSVVSNTQNYLDVVEDGKDALIAGTTQEWYDALNKLVNNRQLRDTMGQSAYEKVMKNYSLDALSENIDQVIKKVLNEGDTDV